MERACVRAVVLLISVCLILFSEKKLRRTHLHSQFYLGRMLRHKGVYCSDTDICGGTGNNDKTIMLFDGRCFHRKPTYRLKNMSTLEQKTAAKPNWICISSYWQDRIRYVYIWWFILFNNYANRWSLCNESRCVESRSMSCKKSSTGKYFK